MQVVTVRKLVVDNENTAAGTKTIKNEGAFQKKAHQETFDKAPVAAKKSVAKKNIIPMIIFIIPPIIKLLKKR